VKGRHQTAPEQQPSTLKKSLVGETPGPTDREVSA
jgi:hypothetical protein